MIMQGWHRGRISWDFLWANDMYNRPTWTTIAPERFCNRPLVHSGKHSVHNWSTIWPLFIARTRKKRISVKELFCNEILWSNIRKWRSWHSSTILSIVFPRSVNNHLWIIFWRLWTWILLIYCGILSYYPGPASQILNGQYLETWAAALHEGVLLCPCFCISVGDFRFVVRRNHIALQKSLFFSFQWWTPR